MVFPQYQGAFAPFLLILACPLAMYFGMREMKPRDEPKPPTAGRQVARGCPWRRKRGYKSGCA
ncbi:DUF2933 domain-containing protein [Cupriavidus necator]|uniref:DUF2933 domain-containing protein n=1 Tax=Cupriavidus necator TaxID=106590 RepID=UPI003F4F9C41